MDDERLAEGAEPSLDSEGAEPKYDYGVLKGYFYTPRRGDVYGAFYFLFDGTNGEVLDKVFWTTRTPSGPPINVSMGWRELGKYIPLMGTYDKSFTEKLGTVVHEVLSSAACVSLMRPIGAEEFLAGLREELKTAFERSTHYFMDLEMAMELVSNNDVAAAGLLNTEANAPKQEAEDVRSFKGTFVTCLPIIDPTRGKAISDLMPGDRVFVKLQGEIGEIVQKYLAARGEGLEFPVESVEKREQGTFCVIFKISDEIRGVMTSTKDIRLSMASVEPKRRINIKVGFDDVVFFGAIGVAALAIVLVIRLFLLS
ncbi:MAG: hypothetical protein LBR38_03955 [Synergistaceae bacterium]|jgi:hypothetical protein|nr:hypothetical protein [Synergistaceae bacterium]